MEALQRSTPLALPMVLDPRSSTRFFLYYSGTLGTGQPIVLRTTMLTAGGLLFTSIASPAAYTQAFFDPITWPFAIGFAILGILIPTTLINFASPKLTTGMVSIMASSELPVGIFAAWAIVGDAPSPLVLFGAFLVFGRHCCQATSVPHKTKYGHSFVNRGRGKCPIRAMGASHI